MYAVLVEGSVAYLGSDPLAAAEVLKAKGPTAVAAVVNNLEELEQAISSQNRQSVEEEVVEGLSRAAARLFEILDNSGLTAQNVEKVTDTLKSRGEQAVTQVRSLGVKSMKTVGEGFIALGDLLRKAAEKPDETQE